MELLIFRTNIENQLRVKKLEKSFSRFANIKSWTVDVEDVDKVLKVHIDPPLSQVEVQNLVNNCGFVCEEL